jgi:hypothetical protein
MICTEELLALVALAELVDGYEVVAAFGPIRSWEVREVLPTVSTNVRGCWNAGLRWRSMIDISVWRNRVTRVKGGLIIAI